ncbi:hypothetical protein CHS0354_032562 [Potamilus streckersoni]|uniref:Uncharacterized protein n=1 Tax=Potamilus streckersoni TaxID=2493646 RepID=A0AAE0VZY5_9BIVA|nr:hypothetical protein CHS0354_032562 [Potamilus streckersoni]
MGVTFLIGIVFNRWMRKEKFPRLQPIASALRDSQHSAQQIVEYVILNNISSDNHNLPKVNNLKRLANIVRTDLRPHEPHFLDFEAS